MNVLPFQQVKMGDDGGGFDPCECVWGHEMAMRRLLSVVGFLLMCANQ